MIFKKIYCSNCGRRIKGLVLAINGLHFCSTECYLDFKKINEAAKIINDIRLLIMEKRSLKRSLDYKDIIAIDNALATTLKYLHSKGLIGDEE